MVKLTRINLNLLRDIVQRKWSAMVLIPLVTYLLLGKWSLMTKVTNLLQDTVRGPAMIVIDELATTA